MFRTLVCSLLLGLSACMGEKAPAAQAAGADGHGLPECAREPVYFDRVDGTFLVFLDRGSDGLTEHARAALAGLAEYWLKNGGRALTVAGHVDASETGSRDRGLGARRAQAAAAYLAELGIPADRISAGDAGASRPLVRTPPGAPEPQNRFVDFGMSLNGNPVAVADAMYRRALCVEWLRKTYCDTSATRAEARACSNAVNSC